MVSTEVSAPSATSQSIGRLVIPTLALTSFVSFIVQLALGPFLPTIAASLGVSVALLGQIPAAAVLAATPLGLIIGPLADRFGLRRALLLGMVAVSLGALGIGVAPAYLPLLLAVVISAVGRAIVQPVGMAVAGTRLTGDARRRAISWLMAGSSGAGILGIPVLTALDALLGWRMAFAILAALCLALVLVVRQLLPTDPAVDAPAPRLGHLLAAYRPLLQHRPSLGLIGSSVIGPAGIWATWTYIGAFFVERYGYSTQAVGWVYMVTASAILLGSLATGGRLGRLPMRPLLIISRLLLALLIASVLIVPIPDLLAVSLLTLSCLMIGVAGVSSNMLLTSETPAGRATTMALNQSAIGLGTALGASLGGLLLALGGYSAISLGTLSCLLASAVIVWWSRTPAGVQPLPTVLPGR